jgi:hypothetical protein
MENKMEDVSDLANMEPRSFEPSPSAVHRRHNHNVNVRRCSEIRMVTPNSKEPRS